MEKGVENGLGLCFPLSKYYICKIILFWLENDNSPSSHTSLIIFHTIKIPVRHNLSQYNHLPVSYSTMPIILPLKFICQHSDGGDGRSPKGLLEEKNKPDLVFRARVLLPQPIEGSFFHWPSNIIESKRSNCQLQETHSKMIQHCRSAFNLH